MSTSRRAFLKGGAAVSLSALSREARAAPTALAENDQAPHSGFDPWVEVNATHLRANALAVRRHMNTPVLAVIKNNGYGAGLLNVARALESLNAVYGFAVVKLHEAHLLRDGNINKPVLLMGPVDERDIADAARRGIMPMVYTPMAEALDRAAGKINKPVNIHVCVDTGLGRVGVPYDRAEALIRGLAANRGVSIRGIMMTFAEDPAFDREQLRRFTALIYTLYQARIRFGLRHAASTYTLFQHPDVTLDLVRPGMALYGVYPEPAFRKSGLLELAPAIALKTRVAYVKQLQAGESAGYERAYKANGPVWIATLPVGHADGLPRSASRGGRVRIKGTLYPIVATVSASHTIVELGADRRVDIGDEATIFDWTEGSRPEDFAASCGASVYDLTMHLNPLLPRKAV